jgi:hypothetical protein
VTAMVLWLMTLAAGAPPDFDRDIAPLLARRCLSCHAGDGPKGNLDLTTRTNALRGGDSGPSLSVDDLPKSNLWQRIADDEMPPKHPLPANEKALIQAWLAAGAKWSDAPIDPLKYTSAERAGYDWWSLQSLSTELRPPHVAGAQHPIDAFVSAKRAAVGLASSPSADRALWIRRVTYDLLGLPPSPQEVSEFVDDPAPDAAERLVDRLLASPLYGERWARHWLDVVRFGESNGYERDLPRPDAWHYRDWVIQSLNNDMGYNEFVRWQLAADSYTNDEFESSRALGFLVAGPHDTVVPVVDRMRQVMRQDELEDLIGTVGQTFLGMTINCARCHDHKFDPISAKEYYQFVAAFAGVNHAEREITTAENARQLQTAKSRVEQLTKALQGIEEPAKQAVIEDKAAEREDSIVIPAPVAAWDFNKDLRDLMRSTLHGEWKGDGKRTDKGIEVRDSVYVATPPLPFDLTAKTLEVRMKLADLMQRGGGAITVQSMDGSVFDSIVFGEQESQRWMAGSNGFVRTRSFQAPAEVDADKEFITLTIVYHADGTIAGFRNGVAYGKPYRSSGLATFSAGKAQVVFGLRHSPVGGNHSLKGIIAAARLYDRALSNEEVMASAQSSGIFISEAEILAKLNDEQSRQREQFRIDLLSAQKELAQREKAAKQKMYTTQSTLQPGPSYVLRRGNVADRGDAVVTAGLTAIRAMNADLQLKADSLDHDRRKRLAEWITDRRNPLFARVMANRLWHYHFGAGLVENPSDLGFNGGTPSHPELLDWLAAELVRCDYSLKHMHRLIVTTATYQQSSQHRADAAKVDAHNRYLWRMNPKRLDAEMIRDTMLAVTDTLVLEVGGKGYSDVNSYFFKGTQFYDPIDPTGPQASRRTIYRAWARGGRNPLLDTFDCPDPSTTTPKRSQTTTPLQALSLMNHSFILRMADQFAERLQRDGNKDSSAAIRQAFSLAYSRAPSADELAQCTAFVEKYGWSSFCRGLLNSSEFLYVD